MENPNLFRLKTNALALASYTKDSVKLLDLLPQWGFCQNNNYGETWVFSSPPFFPFFLKCKSSENPEASLEVCLQWCLQENCRKVLAFAACVSCRCAESVQTEAAAAAAVTVTAAAAAALTHTCSLLGSAWLGRVCKNDISPSESFSPSLTETQSVISPEGRFLATC